MSDLGLPAITREEFYKLTPEQQASVLERQTEHLSHAARKLWQDGQPTKKELYDLWERSKGVYSLTYIHNGMTYKGW